MSVLLDNILRALLTRLIERDALLLAEDADLDGLVTELRARLAEAPPFTQAGPILAGALLKSARVDELFASDSEIIEALSAIQA